MQYREKNNKEILLNTIDILCSQSKGILAADESVNTIGKRFENIGIINSYENRQNYRQMLVSTNNLEKYISGIILYEETFYNKYNNSLTFPEYLQERHIVPGIKVDQGLISLIDHEHQRLIIPNYNYNNNDDEKVTKGLETLNLRCLGYYNSGARFTKWRCVFKISDNSPSSELISKNIETLTQFAKISQNNNLVPIVEPEILMDGNHNIQKCESVTQNILNKLFESLSNENIILEGMILKVNMIKNGIHSNEKAELDDIVNRTANVLLNSVPKEVAGIYFLSGGISETESTNILCNINKKLQDKPWYISFSYGRALQNSALQEWNGKDSNVLDAQKQLLNRARINSLAVCGIHIS